MPGKKRNISHNGQKSTGAQLFDFFVPRLFGVFLAEEPFAEKHFGAGVVHAGRGERGKRIAVIFFMMSKHSSLFPADELNTRTTETREQILYLPVYTRLHVT